MPIVLRLRRNLSLLTVATLLALGGLALAPAPPAFAEPDHEEEEFLDEEDEHDEHEEMEHEFAEYELFFAELDAITRVMDIIDQVTATASDPDAAAVSAVLSVEELAESDAEQAEMLSGMLDDARSGTVERAIRMRLIDVYRHSDQPEKALEQVRLLVTGAGSSD